MHLQTINFAFFLCFPALVVSVAMAWLCVAWSNAKNRYFHYFTVVFFEIVVLVQSGNFSCVNA